MVVGSKPTNGVTLRRCSSVGRAHDSYFFLLVQCVSGRVLLCDYFFVWLCVSVMWLCFWDGMGKTGIVVANSVGGSTLGIRLGEVLLSVGEVIFNCNYYIENSI